MMMKQMLWLLIGSSVGVGCQVGSKMNKRQGREQAALASPSDQLDALDFWHKKKRLPKKQCLPSWAQPNFGFNGLIYADMNQKTSDSEGRLAVGGNATFEDYLIGSKLTPDPQRVDLLVGKNLVFTRGEVRSGATVYGGTATVEDVVFFGGTYQLPDFFSFDRAAQWGRTLSWSTAGYPANGTVEISGAGPKFLLSLTGTQRHVNVFQLQAADIANAFEIKITAPVGSTVIVNILGSSVSMSTQAFTAVGVTAKNILLNMVNATTLNIEAIGVLGSILAPYADVTFNNAAIDGYVVVRSMSGTGEFHWVPFEGCIPWPHGKKSNHTSYGSGPVVSPE